MAFMKHEITPRKMWYKVDGTNGTNFEPGDLFTKLDAIGMYTGKVESVERVYGYGARLSAPGYLDCTDWNVFNTVEKAENYLTQLEGE